MNQWYSEGPYFRRNPCDNFGSSPSPKKKGKVSQLIIPPHVLYAEDLYLVHPQFVASDNFLPCQKPETSLLPFLLVPDENFRTENTPAKGHLLGLLFGQPFLLRKDPGHCLTSEWGKPETRRGNNGESWGNHGKFLGKPWEIMEKPWKTTRPKPASAGRQGAHGVGPELFILVVADLSMGPGPNHWIPKRYPM